ncbi:MAG: DUF2029 domain-containing protein [Deltaproteobacteria bacterium]|nr:DUF2029 domain-containing protein [Deltaproteobacteria bacterium]
MSEERVRRYLRWLLVAIATCAMVNLAIVAFALLRGESLETALSASGLRWTPALLRRTESDSIKPMASAYTSQKKHGDIYRVLLNYGVKFQYPPSALLLMKPLPEKPTAREILDIWDLLSKASLIAVIITIISAAALWLKLARPNLTGTMSWRSANALGAVIAIGVLGATYYPLTKGHNLGQIQVYLGAFSAAALLLQELGLRASSGICLGLCCLIKPQFALLILWALLRRQFRFLTGFSLIVLLGLGLSISEFGLKNHLRYLEVLHYLSRTGESYWPNQSINGLLNRFLENGNAVDFQPFAFAPYHPVVYYATMASSALILFLALFLPAAASLKGRSLDLAVIMCAATMASPIAWEHHYGAFFPIYAIALVAAIQSRGRGFLLLASYALVSNELLRPDLVFANRWIGILGSHIFFGALLLFGFLLSVRAPTAHTICK